MEKMETQPPFTMFNPLELQVLISKLEFTKDIHLNLGWGVDEHELGSSTNGSKNPTRHISTLKFVDEVAAEVM
jgi:hypothetical protein